MVANEDKKEDRGVVPQFNENNVEQWVEDFQTFLMRKEQIEVAVEPPPKKSDFGKQPLTLMVEKAYRQVVRSTGRRILDPLLNVILVKLRNYSSILLQKKTYFYYRSVLQLCTQTNNLTTMTYQGESTH